MQHLPSLSQFAIGLQALVMDVAVPFSTDGKAFIETELALKDTEAGRMEPSRHHHSVVGQPASERMAPSHKLHS